MLLLTEPKHESVRERWARVAKLGLARESEADPVLTSEHELLTRREGLVEVFREEREILTAFSGELLNGPRVVIVADAEGVILSARSQWNEVEGSTRMRLVEGAHWGESTRGTNAIGTAALEGRAVAVVGGAHYELRNRELYCYATPVRDAYGEVVAILDVSGPLARHDERIGIAVQAAGLAMERALRTVAFADSRSGALATIERLIERAGDASLLVDASGLVRAINRPARVALGLAPSLHIAASLTSEQVFGLKFAQLISGAGRESARFETHGGIFRVTIEPVLGRAGRPLAALVRLEPERVPQPRPSESAAFARILGQDPRITKAKTLAATFARTPLPVLLLAETGTGKELFARAIHAESDRRDQPFVAINCGALAPELIASELFGVAPGAFTGAARAGSDGRIAAAHRGTLFLDEIAEMPAALQASLLRVLDDGVYQRVGDTKDRKADFRLVCATCRDLPAMVADGRFRKDLFYRIHGACVTLPPLREREDVVWLAQRLLEPHSLRLADSAADFIRAHDWPGNVRELKSAMAHAAALADGSEWVQREQLPTVLVTLQSKLTPQTRDGILQQAIDEALRATGGNVSEAARRLGVGRGTIYRAMRGRDEPGR